MAPPLVLQIANLTANHSVGEPGHSESAPGTHFVLGDHMLQLKRPLLVSGRRDELEDVTGVLVLVPPLDLPVKDIRIQDVILRVRRLAQPRAHQKLIVMKQVSRNVLDPFVHPRHQIPVGDGVGARPSSDHFPAVANPQPADRGPEAGGATSTAEGDASAR